MTLDDALRPISQYLGKPWFATPGLIWTEPNGYDKEDSNYPVLIFDWRSFDASMKVKLVNETLHVFQGTYHIEGQPDNLHWISKNLAPCGIILYGEAPRGVLFVDLKKDGSVILFEHGRQAKERFQFAADCTEMINKLNLKPAL
ncbi:MAG: hypothetical protein BMS9Abin11_0977 [Gammaproteobacteria bacterium]|nr:MAG: hypothetical protein BMS9Abin11_0977 [Gammaproteobacteria bacterium]